MSVNLSILETQEGTSFTDLLHIVFSSNMLVRAGQPWNQQCVRSGGYCMLYVFRKKNPIEQEFPRCFVAVWSPQPSSSFAKFAFREATTQWFSALSWSNALQWKTCSWRFGSGRRQSVIGKCWWFNVDVPFGQMGGTGPLSRILPWKWCFPTLESHWAHWSCSHFQVPGVWRFAKRVQLFKISVGFHVVPGFHSMKLVVLFQGTKIW